MPRTICPFKGHIDTGGDWPVYAEESCAKVACGLWDTNRNRCSFNTNPSAVFETALAHHIVEVERE